MEIINEINEKKEKEENFYLELTKLEAGISNIDKVLLPQIYVMLANDYLFYDEIEKAFSYYKLAFEGCFSFIQSNILDSLSLVLHINLILDVIFHIVEIVFNHKDVVLVFLKNIFIDQMDEYVYVLPSKLMSNEEMKSFIKKIVENRNNFRDRHHRIFSYLIQKYSKCILEVPNSFSSGIKYLNYSLLFIQNQEGIDEVMEILVNLNKFTDILSNIKKLSSYLKVKILLLFIDGKNHDKHFLDLRNNITKDNNRKILQDIIVIELKIGKLEMLNKILLDLKDIADMFIDKNIIVMLYSDIYKVFTNKITFILEFIDINKIISFWYLTRRYDKVVHIYRLLSQKKEEYSKLENQNEAVILDSIFLEIDKNILFVSLCKMNHIDEASKVYKKIIRARSLKHEVIEEDLFQDILSEIEFLLQSNNIDTAISMVKGIRTPRIFVDLINKIYKLDRKDFLIETVKIGIEIFGTRNTKLLQIFVSFLHIKEYKIEARYRLEVINMIYNIEELSFAQKEWFFKLIYNNIIDIGFRDEEIVRKSLDLCCKLIEMNKDLTYISLLVYRDSNNKEKVEFLYQKYKKIISKEERKKKESEIDTNIQLLFYEHSLKINDDLMSNEILFILDISAVQNKILLILLELSFPYVTDKRIIIESHRRKILEKTHMENDIISCAVQGNFFLYNFLKSLVGIKLREYLSKNSRRVLRSQLSLTKIIGNHEMYSFFKDLLDDI